MANKILKEIEDQLNCSICLGTYTDPKLLQCFHVCCRQCLARLVDRDLQGELILACPVCRQVTPVPARGVAGLQPAFHINRLLDIVDEHKKGREDDQKEGEASSPKVQSPEPNWEWCCLEHVDKELELYCNTCQELICFHCTLKKAAHHSHDYELLNAAFGKYKETIVSSVEPLQKQLATVDGALVGLDRCSGEISRQEVRIESGIHKSFGQLHEALDARKMESSANFTTSASAS